MITMELKGFENVKEMFKSVGYELSPSQVRGILDSAGQIVAKEAKNETDLPGELGELFKKDIGVYRDHRASSKNAEFILIGPRFKKYTIRNQSGQTIAAIAQHMTKGFQQTERETQAGQKRGHVEIQEQNPVVGALNAKRNEIEEAIQIGVEERLDKVKLKHPEIVR